MMYWGLPVKAWTTLAGFVILACADLVAWRKSWNQAKSEDKPLPAFDWCMALPKWIMGTLAGATAGLAADSLPTDGP